MRGDRSSRPLGIRPRRRADLHCVATNGDAFLHASDREHGVRLNAEARAIWDLCDGRSTIFEIAAALDRRRPCSKLDRYIGLLDTLAALRTMGCLDFPSDLPDAPKSLKFLIGIEDKPYFHWQLPILFESLSGQLPDGWETIAVVCNNHSPLSERLIQIFDAYRVRYYTGSDHPKNQDMDFATGGDHYAPLNRIEALSVAARHVGDADLVFLCDTDTFLFRELDLSIFPRGNAMGENWLIGQTPFFSHRDGPGGVDLEQLLAALGFEPRFEPGGVSVFLTGEALRRDDFKLVRDCFRFAQIVYLAGKVVGPADTWISEMPCFALAATANGVEYEVIDAKPFLVDKDEAIRPGTFYHYYHDPKDRDGTDGAFHGSAWHKQRYFHTDFLETELEEYYEASATDHERYFFELAMRAQRRLAGSKIHSGRDEGASVTHMPTVTVVGSPKTAFGGGQTGPSVLELTQLGLEQSATTRKAHPDHLAVVTRRAKKTVYRLADVDPALRTEVPVACELERPKSLNPAHRDWEWMPQPTLSFLLALRDAYIGDGVVFDANNYYSFGKWWLGAQDNSWELYRGAKEVREIGTAVALGAWCGELFPHFAVEALPKLGLALDLLETGALRDARIVTHRDDAEAARWFWRKLGLEDRIVQKPLNAEAGFVLHADTVLYPDSDPNPGYIGVHPRNSLRPIQARLGILEPVDQDLVLYLDAHYPHTVGNAPTMLKKIEGLLGQTRYDIRRFKGTDDLSANMRAMRRARIVIGPHGSMLANLVFAQPGTHVIEFLPIYRLLRDGLDPRPMYWGLSQAAGLDYWTVEPQNFAFDRPGMQVDEDEVLALVRHLLEL